MSIKTFTAGTLSALVLGVGAVTLGGCARQGDAGADPSHGQGQSQQDAVDTTEVDADTVDLVSAAVDLPNATGQQAATGDRPALRARLFRALHATWVTQGQNGTVTHQAIRGEVTAVSSTSITIKAKDGFSLTYSVSADTRVRARAGGFGNDSTIGAVKVGSRALVTGVGATNPESRLVVFHSGTPRPSSSPSPGTTS